METIPSLIERLRSVKHFSSFTPVQLKTIVTAGTLKKFFIGETIFSEGQDCAGMFVLLRGKIHLCKLGPNGQMTILSVVEPVIMINEVAVLDGGPNPISAIAAENCLTWQIGHLAFQDLLEKMPQIGLGLLKVLARRNRQMLSQYEDISFRNVVSRMAKLILDISRGGKQPIDRKKCSIEEMAQRISTVPEAISRSLNIIKSRALIEVSRTAIIVLRPQELAALAMLEPEK
jgi:CRP/FNR family transcriptional regulator